MKRSMKTILKDAVRLIWQDIKDLKAAMVIIVIYLWVNRTLFHSSCIWVIVTGFPCPGCGLTRAGIALLKGKFFRAFQIHPFIYGIAVLFFCFCFYRYILQKSQKIFVKYLIVLMIGMIIFYVYRMVFVFPGEPPMSYYSQNLINTFLN